MSEPEHLSSSAPGPGRRSWPRLVGLAVAAVVAVVLVVVLVVREGAPGEDEARDVVEDYFQSWIDGDCAYLELQSEELSRDEPSKEECLEAEASSEGEYLEYEVGEVRIDGDRAEVDVDDQSDAPSGPFTAHLVVEDGEWKVDELETHSYE